MVTSSNRMYGNVTEVQTVLVVDKQKYQHALLFHTDTKDVKLCL